MNAVREWLEAVRPPASRSRLAEALTGRRDVLATSDPVENTRMGLPAEPSRYGASLTNRQPDTVDGVRPMFGLPQQAPVVNPREEARTRMMADALMGASGTIRAFHGSPHRFDRFAMSRIGTGEGAQAYGHGLYFADNEAVAGSYRSLLSRVPYVNGRQVTGLEGAAENYLVKANGDVAAAFRAAQEEAAALSASTRPIDRIRATGAQRAAATLDEWQKTNAVTPPGGHMYEVRLNTTPERLLDWDAPVAQNSPAVKAAEQSRLQYYSRDPRAAAASIDNMRASIAGGDRTGAEILEGLTRELGSQGASQALRNAGIDGIQYLDAGSRAAGDGSRNYVMFNDAQIEILRRYGLLGPTVGLGTAAATSGEQ